MLGVGAATGSLTHQYDHRGTGIHFLEAPGGDFQ
jgi:hypothetical protein